MPLVDVSTQPLGSVPEYLSQKAHQSLVDADDSSLSDVVIKWS